MATIIKCRDHFGRPKFVNMDVVKSFIADSEGRTIMYVMNSDDEIYVLEGPDEVMKKTNAAKPRSSK